MTAPFGVNSMRSQVLYRAAQGLLDLSESSNSGAHVGRAGVTPFLAAHLRGYDNFKWMLYGDDDTVFFVDNALDMLEELDHNMPYFLTDHLWFPDQFGENHLAGHNSKPGFLTDHFITKPVRGESSCNAQGCAILGMRVWLHCLLSCLPCIELSDE